MLISIRRFLRFIALILFCITGVTSADDSDWNKLIPVEQLQADFSALYNGLQAAHANLFIHRPKNEYDALFKKMSAEMTKPLSHFEAQKRFQVFTAFGNVAHARVDFPQSVYEHYRDNQGRAFPIYLRIVDGRAYVGENYSGLGTISLGDEIMSLNNVAMSEWLARTSTHISADIPYIAHSLLEFLFPAYLWLELGEVEHFDMRLRTPSGEQKNITLKASTQTEQQAQAAEQQERFVLNGTERLSKILDKSIAYLRPGPFYNIEDPERLWDNTAFVAFINSAFESFNTAKAQKLIIDLRENPGGDNSFSDAMVAWIANEPFRFCSAFLIRSSDAAAASNQARLDANPNAVEGVSRLFAKQYASVPRGEVFSFDIPFVQAREDNRFNGEVYVLVNRHSYSNAVNVAAIVQDYKLGTIVGEKTADMATTYGAMETFTLPATGIEVGFPKAHIIRPSGEKKSDGVSPDIIIPTPIVAGQEDTVLKALLSRLSP